MRLMNIAPINQTLKPCVFALALAFSLTSFAFTVHATGADTTATTVSAKTPGPDSAAIGTPPARTEDQTFSVTAKIFESTSKQASAHHRLLFDAGVVYDLPQLETRFITVFDPAQRQVTLIDRKAKNQTMVSTDDLVKFTAGVKAAATTDAQREQLGLLAQVVPSDRIDGFSIEFSGAQYDVSTQQPQHRWMADDFSRFSDLASRLNLIRHRSLPPFARMSLGFKIASMGELPLQTNLTIRRGDQVQSFRSTATIGVLAAEDRSKIEEVRSMMSLYPQVSWKEFSVE